MVASVGAILFDQSGMSGPYSEGPAGFEYLLSRVNLAELDAGSLTAREAGFQLLTRFSELESCFSGLNTSQPASVRLRHVQALIEATTNLIATLKQEDRSLYGEFIGQIGGEQLFNA